MYLFYETKFALTMLVELQHILIISSVWIVASSLILYRKNVFYKKSKAINALIDDKGTDKDIINYPKPFTISLVFNSNESADSIIISDWIVKYSQLINGNYVVPDHLIGAKEVRSSETGKEEQKNMEAELTSEDMDQLDIPELSKGIFENLGPKDAPIEEPYENEAAGDTSEAGEGDYETLSNINSEF